MPILAWFVREVMETVDKKVHLGFHPSIARPSFGVVAGLNGLVNSKGFPCEGLFFPHQMTRHRSLMRGTAVLPEVYGLPSSQYQATILNTQAQGLARQGGADVGWHVIGAFVVMDIRTTFWHHIRHPSLEVLKNPWIGILINREAGACVEAGEMQHTLVQSSGPQPSIQRPIDTGEASAWGR
jgi:hypothetical protein